MSAPTKNVVDLPPASTVELTDKVLLVDVSDTSEGPLGTVKVAETQTVGTVFGPYISQAENAADQAAASAAAAAEIVNISEVQTFTNPLSRAVRIAMTAAASGSNGIQVLDNVQADFGTGNYTLVRRVFVASTRPSANQILSQKHDGTNGRIVTLLTTGVIRHTINGTNYDSTTALPSASNVFLDLAIVVTRETASAAGSVVFYNNGSQVGASVTIPAGAPVSVDNAVSEYILGTSTTRVAGEVYNWANYNRALSAAEVLSLSNKGPELADLGASQTPVYASNFSAGVDSWGNFSNTTLTGNVDGIAGQDNWLMVEVTASGAARFAHPADSVRFPFTAWRDTGKYARLQIQVYIDPANTGTGGLWFQPTTGSAAASQQFIPRINSLGGYVGLSDASPINTTGSIVSLNAEVIGRVGGTADRLVGWIASGAAAGDKFYVRAITVNSVGIPALYDAKDAQSDTGQIFDSSGNGNHALLPAAGATVIGRPQSDPRRVEWPNTWAGTSELQYIGGVNQAILETRTGWIVMDIFNTGSSVTVDVGDGVDQDRFVAAAVLASGPNRVTFASPFTDGTNRKLTIKPSASFTGTLITSATYQLVRAS